MDIRFIETLVTVSEQGSLTGAARRLNLTPTAVAQRIRALEDEFGAKLVTRSGRVVQPTEAGRAILEQAPGFLDAYRDLKTRARQSRIEGELRLGAVATALTGFLPDVIGKLAARHTGIDLFLSPNSSSELYDQVLSGRLDAAVLLRPSFVLPKSLSFCLCKREKIVLIVPEDEPLSDAVKILQNRPFIRYDQGQWGGRLAADVTASIGVPPRERFELDALDAIVTMVGRGLGVSVIPDFSDTLLVAENVRKISVPGPPVFREIGLVWKTTAPRLHLVNALIEEIKNR